MRSEFHRCRSSKRSFTVSAEVAGKERKGKERKRKGKEKERKEKGKERKRKGKGKERKERNGKGKERKERERKGKERKGRKKRKKGKKVKKVEVFQRSLHLDENLVLRYFARNRCWTIRTEQRYRGKLEQSGSDRQTDRQRTDRQTKPLDLKCSALLVCCCPRQHLQIHRDHFLSGWTSMSL